MAGTTALMHVAAPGAERGIEIGTRKHLVGGVGVEGDIGGMLGGGLQELVRRGGRGHDTIAPSAPLQKPALRALRPRVSIRVRSSERST